MRLVGWCATGAAAARLGGLVRVIPDAGARLQIADVVVDVAPVKPPATGGPSGQLTVLRNKERIQLSLCFHYSKGPRILERRTVAVVAHPRQEVTSPEVLKPADQDLSLAQALVGASFDHSTCQ